MSIGEIINVAGSVVLFLLTLFFSGLAYYKAEREKLEKIANDAINGVEDMDEEIGKSICDAAKSAQKLQLAVTELMVHVPKILRLILNRTVVERIVQLTFDKVQEYANKQLCKKLIEKK